VNSTCLAQVAIAPSGRRAARGACHVSSPGGIAECIREMIEAMHLFKTLGNEFLQTPKRAVVDTTGLELSDSLIEIFSAGPGMAAA
jgi:hypothetical protein